VLDIFAIYVKIQAILCHSVERVPEVEVRPGWLFFEEGNDGHV